MVEPIDKNIRLTTHMIKNKEMYILNSHECDIK